MTHFPVQRLAVNSKLFESSGTRTPLLNTKTATMITSFPEIVNGLTIMKTLLCMRQTQIQRIVFTRGMVSRVASIITAAALAVKNAPFLIHPMKKAFETSCESH